MDKILLGLLRLFSWGFGKLSRPLQTRLGNTLGWIFYWSGFRRKVVEQNLALAFPGDQAMQAKVLRQSYLHFGNLILEVSLLFGPLKNFIEKNADPTGLEHFAEAHRQGKGIIILSSHVGNWEVMAATGGILAGLDLMLVTKRLKPAWFHEAVERGRRLCGVKATYEPRTAKDILSHLKNNKAIGFVLDQYSGPPVGVRVPVFGTPVGTSLAVAAIAKRTGAPVIPVVNYRLPNGRWQVEVRAPLVWVQAPDAHRELALNTAQFSSVLEKDIFDHPEQWLWVHRRFKGDLSPLRPDEWDAPRVRK